MTLLFIKSSLYYYYFGCGVIEFKMCLVITLYITTVDPININTMTISLSTELDIHSHLDVITFFNN